MNALTSGRRSASWLGYMKIGRDRGLYSPLEIASWLGLTQPLPASTPTRFSLSLFCS
jgi:hypothetical protein